MKIRNKIIIFILLFCLLNITSCSRNIVQLENLGLVFGTGLDKVDGDHEIHLTAQVIEMPEENKNMEKKSGQSSCITIQSTGETVFEAIRNATDKCFRPLYFSHSKLILISSELAKEGVQDYLDIFFRNTQPRPNTWIVICEDKASKVLDEVPGLFIDQLIKTKKERATISVQNMHDFMSRIVSKTTAPITGMIRLKEEGERIDIDFMGTAVFEDDKLIGMLDKKETRGLLWVLDEIESNLVVVDSADEMGKIGVEILSLKSKIKPKMKNNEFSIEVEITTTGRIAELVGKEDITEVKTFKALQDRMAETIEEEILLCLKKSKSLKADTFGFGDEINKKYHKEFKKVEGEWKEIFANLEVDIKVNAKILGIGTILKTFE